jgi:hypothetical protein
LAIDHTCISLGSASGSNGSASQQQSSIGELVQNRMSQMLASKASSNPMAAKLRMMNQRSKAVGNSSIPEDKRFYLEVIYPMDSKVAPQVMFFNSSWSIGKVLDVIAEQGKIANRNHEPNQPVSLKNQQQKGRKKVEIDTVLFSHC